jgi:subtilisin-like proprotein convertase family protein
VPAAIAVTNTVQAANAIPDAGLRLVISGEGVPSELQSIVALPSLGIHSEGETATLPLVHVGQALTPLTTNLTGKAALIQRGGGDFSLKIQNAADAGAEFAIVYNNQGSTSLQILGGTDFVPIPAISISQRDGEALVALMATNTVQARIDLETLDYEFNVATALITEHVLVHLDHFHEARGDMRVTLVSPKGTRSVLQRLGQDITRFDGRWTYMTTHHFYESPVGSWRLELSDESTQAVGAVREATLEVRGIPIVDLDTDGLDDVWEVSRIGSLASGATDDPDNDGYSNAREQIQGKDPRVNDSPLQVDLSKWNESYIRLNWPARNGVTYEVLGATDVTQPFQVLATVPGGFPRAAWFGNVDARYKFFTVREKAP